jgi:tetratricopeptide (TPR) repeat protein
VGHKLTVLALSALAGTAWADKASDALKKGIELYKAEKYEQAAKALQKAYDLDPKPEILFPLAQAQRLSGDCLTAAQNYKKVIEQIGDLNTAKLVQQALRICEPEEPEKPKKEEIEKPEPEPKIVTKVVTRDVPGHSDRLAATLFAVGTLSIGAAAGLYLASGASSDAANQAHTLDQHNSLQDKAGTEQTAALVAGGLGVALMTVAIVRWVRSDDEQSSTNVAVVPTAGGGGV